jgi:hypothetical protein
MCGEGETTLNCPDDCPICVEDGNCDTDAGENAINCEADCGAVECTLAETGDDHDFLVSQVFLPDDQASSETIGMDLDGDGVVDNKLGLIVATLADTSPSFDVNAEVNDDIQSGHILMVLRERVDQFGDDDVVVTQILKGEITDASPLFEGNDELALHADADTDDFVCGRLTTNELMAGPAEAVDMPFPLPGMGALMFNLRQVQLLGTTTETGWTEVMLGGGVPEEQIDSVLYPALLQWMNELIQADPNDELAQGMIMLLDGLCDNTLEGCESTVQGAGECDNTADPPVISETELRCSRMMSTALSPDVDLDGDGTPDAISVGLRIEAAVPVTIVP